MNEYLKPLYMHKTKKQVVTAHNLVTVGQKEFMVSEDFLLLDLNKKGDQKSNLS